jgi:hypothetical protein
MRFGTPRAEYVGWNSKMWTSSKNGCTQLALSKGSSSQQRAETQNITTMDYNIPDDEESSNSGVSSTASGKPVEQVVPRSRRSMAGVILARNISKFFAAKLNPAEANDASSSNSNSIDVCAVLQDVDEILDHRSIEDGRLLLRGMVADLLKEMDVLRYKYDTLHDQYRNVKEERDVVNHEYNDRIYSLTVALNHAVSAAASSKTNPTAADETTTTLTNLLKEKVQSGQVLTAEEATMMTIQTLTGKIAQLHLKNGEQYEEMMKLQERIEDLTSDNEAKVYKILALEKQFLNINTKRNKVVTKYTPTDKKKPMMILRPLQIPDSRRTPVKEEVDNKENIIANIIMTPKNETMSPEGMSETMVASPVLAEAVPSSTTLAPPAGVEVPEMPEPIEALPEMIVSEKVGPEEEDPLAKLVPSVVAATPSLVELVEATAPKPMAEPVPITPDAKATQEAAPSEAAPVLRTQSVYPAVRKSTKHGGHRVARLVKLVEQV